MNPARGIKHYLGKRKRDTHKGHYGRILIVAGSQGLSGACVMTSMAALRAGAGLVTVGVPASLMLALARRMTEAMTCALPETKAGSLGGKASQSILRMLAGQDVLAIGPGLSQHRETQAMIRKTVLASKKPMVIDADGLNAFKGKAAQLKKLCAPAVLTPHPVEFRRLFGGPAFTADSDRKERACEAARKFRVIIVLKGHRTVVSAPGGKVYVNRTGNPGMATGGSGDVLTGMISAMMGQKIPPFEAACYGVYLHGLAGDIAARKRGQVSLVASDLIESLPAAFKRTIGRG